MQQVFPSCPWSLAVGQEWPLHLLSHHFRSQELFLKRCNTISNGRWWITRAEKIGASRSVLDTNKIHLSFSYYSCNCQKQVLPPKVPTDGFSPAPPERTELRSLSACGKWYLPSLTACDHVTFWSHCLLGIGSGPQATAFRVKSVAVPSLCIRHTLEILCKSFGACSYPRLIGIRIPGGGA